MEPRSEVMDAIETRRSCRAYEGRQVEFDKVEDVIAAGTWAPSGMGRQPCHFVVLQDPDQIKRLSAMNAKIMGSTGDPFYGAPTVVVVLVDPSVPTCVEDGSLALGSMMLEAHNLGLGSCWIHRAHEEFDSAEGKALLKEWGVEGDWRGVGHCLLGYAAEHGEKTPAPRKGDSVTYVR
ncbi:MAG: nitroreductase [Atopobiaceae bacterium]|nr:nitroreductase [Atopobiaceae bacterium]MCH4214056.1 nitroreductase [Atopobiaceae bacterium]MCH4229519.1 nitroreductase [Atopobiaceae bacterium]MCH4276408.1 nitroreductase [Atopobiaceae bacterium]MCI1226495.1 nitroreductase [Atopobiaceae bacterium]